MVTRSRGPIGVETPLGSSTPRPVEGSRTDGPPGPPTSHFEDLLPIRDFTDGPIPSGPVCNHSFKHRSITQHRCDSEGAREPPVCVTVTRTPLRPGSPSPDESVRRLTDVLGPSRNGESQRHRRRWVFSTTLSSMIKWRRWSLSDSLIFGG